MLKGKKNAISPNFLGNLEKGKRQKISISQIELSFSEDESIKRMPWILPPSQACNVKNDFITHSEM